MSPRQPSTTRRRKGSTGRRLTVVNITLQSEEWDYDKEVSLAGTTSASSGSAPAATSSAPRSSSGSGPSPVTPSP